MLDAMQAWFASWTPTKWDTTLTYSFSSQVIIRDKWLGLTRLLVTIGVLLYIIIKVFVVDKGYLDREPATAVVRMNYQQPAIYRNVSQMAYCNGSLTPSSWNRPCIYLDGTDVSYPEIERDALLASTRISETNQELHCNASTPDCTYTVTDSRAYYVADIEGYTLRTEHSVNADRLGFAATSRYMDGYLQYKDGRKCRIPDTASDVLYMHDILDAAGIPSLDIASNPAVCSGRSARYDGVVIVMTISYTRNDDFSLPGDSVPFCASPIVPCVVAPSSGSVDSHGIIYRYTFDVLPNEYKVQQSVISSYFTKGFSNQSAYYDANETLLTPFATRTVRDRHGVYIQVVTGGTLGSFDFQVMLVQVTAALSLVVVAAYICQGVAMYLLPHKHHYRLLMFKKTRCFSEVPVDEHQHQYDADYLFEHDRPHTRRPHMEMAAIDTT